MKKDIVFLNSNIFDTIIDNMPSNQIFANIAYFYSIFGDVTRLKVIIALSLSEMCVNDLSNVLNINQTTISHQLKVLKSIGAVTITKKNKYTFYKVTDKFVNEAMINGINYIISKKAS